MRIAGIFERFRDVRNSKDGKTIIENFTYLSLLQVAGYVFPFITIPYLSRIIGVDGFGHLAFASALIVWVQTIVDWGFGYSATRDVARNRNNTNRLSEIYSNVLWTKILLAIICFFILLLLTFFIPVLRENMLVLLLTFLLIPGAILFPEWFFQGMEEMKYITIFNISIKFAFTIAIFFVIKEKDDYVFQPLLISMGYIISGLVSYYVLNTKWGVSLRKPRFKAIKFYLRDSFDIFIGNLFPTMYNNFSAVLLGAIGSPRANGIYDGGNKFVSVAQSFIVIIGRTFYPFLNRRSDKFFIYEALNLTVIGIASIILFLIAPYIVHIFLTPEFEDSIIVLRILSVSLFFLGLGTIYCVNYLFVKGYDKDARNITIISSVIGFLLAYPLIKWFSFVGAAINVTITRAIMGVLYMVVAKKRMRQ